MQIQTQVSRIDKYVWLIHLPRQFSKWVVCDAEVNEGDSTEDSNEAAEKAAIEAAKAAENAGKQIANYESIVKLIQLIS